MALTQISTAGVKDDAVTSGKIPANAVGSSELADNAVDTAAIADDAVTDAKLANSINSAIAANTAKNTNATHTGDVTGSGALTIADNAVTTNKINTNAVTTTKIAADAIINSLIADNAVETANIADQQVTLAKLEHGTSSNNGKFLRANNGADPTFETVNTDLVSDTSPQLGGNLDTNSFEISLDDSHNINFGDGDDFKIRFDGTNSIVEHTPSGSGYLGLQSDTLYLQDNTNGHAYITCVRDGAVGLRYDNSEKFKTLTDGCQTIGKLGVNTSSPAKNLHVADSGVATVRIETTDSRGQAWDILSTNGAQNNTGTLSFRDESGSEYLGFGANGGSPELTVRNGGANDLLVVDNEGHVTKPKTAAFLAHHQSADLNYAVGDTLAYAYEVFDIGSDYNTSNYTFTAPVDGRYLFSANANANYDNGVSGIPRAYWKINGSNVAQAIHLRGSDNQNTGSDADGLEQRSQTVIFNLSANDTVNIVVGQNRWDLFGANSFCGYLLG